VTRTSAVSTGEIATVLLYTRQSVSEGTETLSLTSQADALARYATEHGWRIVGEVRDAGEKGWDETRPGLAEVIARCAAGGIDAVLVWELSRLARSLRLQENTLHQLAEYGTVVVSLREPWVAQPLFRQLIGAIAEEQTRTISAHTRRAIAARAHRGVPWGIPPYGYVRPEPAGPVVVDPDAAAVVREVFVLFLSGHGVTAIADILTARGQPTPRGYRVWRDTTVGKLLDHRGYLGEIAHQGSWLTQDDGAPWHEPIIDEATFAAAAELRGGRRRRPRRKRASSWLEGLIEHACGGRMYLMPAHGLNRPFFRCYYRSNPRRNLPACGVSPQSMAAWMAERAARDQLVADLSGRRTLRDALARARLEARQNRPRVDARRRDLLDRHQRLDARRRNAEELYLSGARDRAWFDAQDAVIAVDLAYVERELAALPAAPDPDRVRATWTRLGELEQALRGGPGTRLGPILAELGVAVVGSGGLSIRYRERVRSLLR
jgi:DNA invertase Pin-like site-specific DNA recombinase